MLSDPNKPQGNQQPQIGQILDFQNKNKENLAADGTG